MTERYEVMPFERAVEEASQLPEHVRLTVTCSPKHGLDESIAFAQRLRELGNEVTLHLAARMVRSRGHLDELLARMAETGIDDAFVIAGDATPPLGPFESAVGLVPLVHEHAQRPRTLGIAGYPEGHPLVDDDTLAWALRTKMPFADYVTTQLCYDPEAILRFAAGVELPVLAGVPGLVDPRRLLEISLRVGVGPSISYLRKQRRLRSLFSSASAERVHDALVGRDEIAGFHYFTFNRLLDTWSWARETTTKEVLP
jgi:methylenetetrahydrofolate reductase (NADPH)